MSGQKYPALKEWPKVDRNPQCLHEIETLARGGRHYSLGIATGTIIGGLQVVAIDLDVEGAELDLLIASLPFSPMMKIGRKGATLFFLCDPDLPSRVYLRLKKVLVDFLANKRQTAAPPSIHPETGRSYVWALGPVAAEAARPHTI